MVRIFFFVIVLCSLLGCNSNKALSALNLESLDGKWSLPCFSEVTEPELRECLEEGDSFVEFKLSETQYNGQEISQSPMMGKRAVYFEIKAVGKSRFMVFDYGKDDIRKYEIIRIDEELIQLKNEEGTYYRVYWRLD